ncbi:glycoside hydrolase family 108 protein [Rhizobium pisi]|uniref:glycoside hydrolase family 108 protein n=1 Tax=Rhizobium pisi TaxID=574561 RepID=UPI003D023DD2
MTAANYLPTMHEVSINEGGWSDHPDDPGGATMKGIIQREYDAFRKRKGRPLQSVRYITDDEVAEIYRSQYASKVRFDDLPAGVDYATLDGAINSGVSRGSKWLQGALGVKTDGVIGNQTVSAAVASDAVKTIKKMCGARSSFLHGLSTFKVFGKGWSARVARVEATSVAMAQKSRGAQPSGIAASALIESESAKKNSTSASGTAGASALGSGTSATQVDWTHLTGTQSLILIAVVLGGIALAAYLFHRSRTQMARSEAYAAVAAGA